MSMLVKHWVLQRMKLSLHNHTTNRKQMHRSHHQGQTLTEPKPLTERSSGVLLNTCKTHYRWMALLLWTDLSAFMENCSIRLSLSKNLSMKWLRDLSGNCYQEKTRKDSHFQMKARSQQLVPLRPPHFKKTMLQPREPLPVQTIRRTS
jgi:hypothetical protein